MNEVIICALGPSATVEASCLSRGGHPQLPPAATQLFLAQVTSQLVKAHRKSWETSGMDRWMLKVKTPPAHPGVIKLSICGGPNNAKLG